MEFSFSFMIATNPAKIGVSKLVPPATVRFTVLTSRKPFEQLPVIPVLGSLEQYRKPALLGDAVKEISGTKRKLPEGMPGTPVCQAGLAVRTLTPPPVELSVPGLPLLGPKSSFQTCSGM
jgi:hypothetical protein